MISYKKQKYNDIRTPMTDEVFVQLVQETLKVNGVKVKEEVAYRKNFLNLIYPIKMKFLSHSHKLINLSSK